MSTRKSVIDPLGVVPCILSGLGKYGLLLSQHWASNKHKVFTSISVNPNGFSDWRDFFVAYQAQNLLKKYPLLQTGINTQTVALDKFLLSEENCRSINMKLSTNGMGLNFRMRSIFEIARSEVKRILGVFSWDSCLPYFSHGPGAAVMHPRDLGSAYHKFGSIKPTITGTCSTLLRTMCEYSALFSEAVNCEQLNIVRSSRVAIVPKDARSGRTIAIEPLWNMYFQKGIGGLIRSRLRRSGINLNDQTTNQQLARIGSVDGSLSTIDLSSASDSISRVLVERLLPEDWVRAMDRTRTHWASLPGGDEIFLQKYSSMGNGFTFELESLIFLALGRAVSKFEGHSGHDVFVYGDDIIVPSRLAVPLIEVLNEVGFKTNIEKTFISGPFRESCGKHYFLGRDVTPFFLKRKIEGVEDIFYLLNSIRRLAFRFLGTGYGLDGRFKKVWDQVYLLLPPRYRGLSIPDGVGDTGVLRDFDEVIPRPRRAANQVSGFTTLHLIRQYSSVEMVGIPALLTVLSPALPRVPSEMGVSIWEYLNTPEKKSLYSKRFKHRVVKLHVPQWPSLGPWLLE